MRYSTELTAWLADWVEDQLEAIHNIKHPNATNMYWYRADMGWPVGCRGRLDYVVHVEYFTTGWPGGFRRVSASYLFPLCVLMLSEDEIRETDLSEYRI